MAEHSSTAPQPRQRLSRVYGLRLLYQPRPRARLLAATALIAVLAHLYNAVVQVVALRGVNVKYDFQQFYDAASSLNHGADPYRAFLDGCPATHWCLGGYIYPPLLAELMRPLATLPVTSALRAWLVISQLCLLAAAVLAWRALKGQVSPAVLSLLLVAAVAFRPLQYTLYFAQVGLPLTAILAVTVWSRMRERGDAGAGTALGLAAVLRVSPLFLLPALLRRPRALAAALGSAVLLLLALLALTPYTAEYFTAVLPRIGASTGILDNQAPQGLLLRAATLWGLPAPSGPLVTLVIAALVVAPTAWLGLRRDGDLPWRGAVIGAFLAAMPLVSSLTWQHHLVIELLVYVALAPALAQGRMGLARPLAILSYPLMWLDRNYTDALTATLGLANPSGWRVTPFLLVTGLNLAGMVCLWVAALLVLRRLARDAAPT